MHAHMHAHTLIDTVSHALTYTRAHTHTPTFTLSYSRPQSYTLQVMVLESAACAMVSSLLFVCQIRTRRRYIIHFPYVSKTRT